MLRCSSMHFKRRSPTPVMSWNDVTSDAQRVRVWTRGSPATPGTLVIPEINEVAPSHVSGETVPSSAKVPAVMNAVPPHGTALRAMTHLVFSAQHASILAAAPQIARTPAVLEIARIWMIEPDRIRRAKNVLFPGICLVRPQRTQTGNVDLSPPHSEAVLTEPASTAESWDTFSVIAPSGLRIHPLPPPQNNEGDGTGASVSAIPAPPPTA